MGIIDLSKNAKLELLALCRKAYQEGYADGQSIHEKGWKVSRTYHKIIRRKTASEQIVDLLLMQGPGEV